MEAFRIWRDSRVWGFLFASVFLARTALDWFAPPADFQVRSTVSTAVGIGLLLLAGFRASRRSGSVAAGAAAGVAAAGLAAVLSVAGAAALLAARHDPAVMTAIQASGGLSEVFELPALMVVPGLVLGTLGGLTAVAGQGIVRAAR